MIDAQLYISLRWQELIQKRALLRICRQAIRAAMEYHGRRVLKKHFQYRAHREYGYKRRNLNYMKKKAKGIKIDGVVYKSRVDMVKTGRSRAYITNPQNQQITVSGSALNYPNPYATKQPRALQARLRTRFPFVGGTGRIRPRRRLWPTAPGVTIQDMVREMKRFSPEDSQTALQQFAQEFRRQIARMPRVQQKFRAAGINLG